MTIPGSQTNMSFKNTIETEFGANPARSLGTYRISQTVHKLSNRPLDTGIPQTGQIAFSHFRGKSLNVVVNLWSVGGTQYHINAKTNKWNNNSVTVIGNFRGKKESGSKIIIHIDNQFRSQQGQERRGNPDRCAVRTGSWSGIVGNLTIDIANTGSLYGSGGRGGNGGRGYQFEGGQPGGSGSSALGVEHPAQVNINGGLLRAGYGGGGGGGYGRQRDKRKDRKASGGGGGGGAGAPFGAGGGVSQSPGPGGSYVPALGGSSSNATTSGDGGRGAVNDNQAYGGAGGEGGQNGNPADGGGSASAGGGAGGGNGSAIRATNGGINISVANSGTYIGGRSNGAIN